MRWYELGKISSNASSEHKSSEFQMAKEEKRVSRWKSDKEATSIICFLEHCIFSILDQHS